MKAYGAAVALRKKSIAATTMVAHLILALHAVKMTNGLLLGSNMSILKAIPDL